MNNILLSLSAFSVIWTPTLYAHVNLGTADIQAVGVSAALQQIGDKEAVRVVNEVGLRLAVLLPFQRMAVECVVGDFLLTGLEQIGGEVDGACPRRPSGCAGRSLSRSTRLSASMPASASYMKFWR